MAAYTTDDFWIENRPAFHAYDYSANIALDVTEELQELRKEEPIRDATADYPSNLDDPMLSSSPPVCPNPPTPADEAESEGGFHTKGLQNLRTELEAKFDLENI